MGFCLRFFIVFVAAFTLLPVSWPIGYLINIGLGALLAYLQWEWPDYKVWVATYGKPTTEQSGLLIPVGIGLGTMAVVVALIIFSPAILPAEKAQREKAQREKAQTLLPPGCPPDCAGVDLREANLSGADLREANLVEADLSEANLEEA